MKIGYAQEDITPLLDRPVFLAGFGNNRRAETVRDPLSVRALSLHTEDTILVLCALDLIGFFRPDVQDVIRRIHTSEVLKTLDISPQIIIASIHTHHGPDTMGLWGPDDRTRGVDANYMSRLKSKVEETIISSLMDPKPASVKSTCINVPGLAKNARNPEIVDNELTTLQFMTTDQRPLVTMMDFPCHPEVLWERNPHITPDYPGYLRDEVERVTEAPCIFFAGALGGMMTPDVTDHSFEEAEFMGKKLAEEGLKALEKVESVQHPKVTIQKAEVKIKLTNILYKIAFIRKLLPDVRVKGMVITEVNLIKIGEAWLATMPGELLPKLGLRLKASLVEAGAKVPGVIGLANDELGYIIPVEDFKYPLNPFNTGSH
jgi:hypothetical protein